MFENPRRGRQARNFTTNVPKILDLKSSSEQIFSRKLPLGAPVVSSLQCVKGQLFICASTTERVVLISSSVNIAFPNVFFKGVFNNFTNLS